MGTLGSVVFFGVGVGSLMAALFMDKIPIKIVLFVSFIGNGVGMFFFLYLTNYYAICFARFLSGFCQIFVFIFG